MVDFWIFFPRFERIGRELDAILRDIEKIEMRNFRGCFVIREYKSSRAKLLRLEFEL